MMIFPNFAFGMFGRICSYPLVSWARYPSGGGDPTITLGASGNFGSVALATGASKPTCFKWSCGFVTNPPVADSVLWSGLESSTRIKGVLFFSRGGKRGRFWSKTWSESEPWIHKIHLWNSFNISGILLFCGATWSQHSCFGRFGGWWIEVSFHQAFKSYVWVLGGGYSLILLAVTVVSRFDIWFFLENVSYLSWPVSILHANLTSRFFGFHSRIFQSFFMVKYSSRAHQLHLKSCPQASIFLIKDADS